MNNECKRRTLWSLHHITSIAFLSSLLFYHKHHFLLDYTVSVQTFIIASSSCCFVFSCVHFVLQLSPGEQSHITLVPYKHVAWNGVDFLNGQLVGRSTSIALTKNTASLLSSNTSSSQEACLDSTSSSSSAPRQVMRYFWVCNSL